MNSFFSINCFVVVLVLVLSGCAGTSSSHSGQHFDQQKAAKTRVSLGLTYLKNGNFSQAKFNLDKALEYAPRSADAHFAMAYYYQNVGELVLAEQTYQFAMDLEPNNANIANSYGAFLCQNGQYNKAKEYFLKAVNNTSYISSAETYENLALCSQSQGKHVESVQYLQSAINHQPGRANSLYLLTLALVETQQFEQAKSALRRYEKLSQVSAQSIHLAMQIEQGLGNEAAAKGYRDMLILMYLNDPITQQLLAKEKTANTANKPSQQKNAPFTTPAKSAKAQQSQATVIKRQAKLTQVQSMPKQQQQASGVNEQKADTPSFHVVSKGENLYRISLLYNIRMQRLIEWNDLPDASAIYEGKKLSLVPPKVAE